MLPIGSLQKLTVLQNLNLLFLNDAKMQPSTSKTVRLLSYDNSYSPHGNLENATIGAEKSGDEISHT